MRAVGVREFRDQATSMMAQGETLVIERHGEPIGFYVPIAAKDRKAGRKALGRLGVAVEGLLATAGLDEDELVAEVGRRRR
jgi:antitoxin (DNA-binding transcriptional repressor) of toxin-antitoxin stability system